MPVQILRASEKPQKVSFGQKLNEGVGRALEFSSQMLQAKEKERQHHEENEAAKKLGIDLSGIRDPKIRQEAVAEHLKGMNQQALQQQKKQELQQQDFEDYSAIEGRFGKNFADIWKAASTGGRTELLKNAIEAARRGEDINARLKGIPENKEKASQLSSETEMLGNQKPSNPEMKVEKEFENYLKTQDEGLLPSEKIKRGQERFSTGLKQYQEASAKLRNLKADQDRFGILESLDKSKKLPEDLERLNVDDEGNLRLPFLASPESQRFVKTLNEFSQGAKDTFGSRVTNFDLAQYLREKISNSFK